MLSHDNSIAYNFGLDTHTNRHIYPQPVYAAVVCNNAAVRRRAVWNHGCDCSLTSAYAALIPSIIHGAIHPPVPSCHLLLEPSVNVSKPPPLSTRLSHHANVVPVEKDLGQFYIAFSRIAAIRVSGKIHDYSNGSCMYISVTSSRTMSMSR